MMRHIRRQELLAKNSSDTGVKHVHHLHRCARAASKRYKTALRYQAKRLRAQGLSIRDISTLLGVAFSVIHDMPEVQ